MVQKYTVGKVSISTFDLEEAVAIVISSAQKEVNFRVHFCNAFTINLANEDSSFESILNNSDLNLPDGFPVAFLGRKFGVNSPIRGADFLRKAGREASNIGIKQYFYGGHPRSEARIISSLSRLGINNVMVDTPPFEPLSDIIVEKLAKRIVNSGAGIVWIGLGTPKQDILIEKLSGFLPTPTLGIGGVFDFLSERKFEAPRWIRGSGFEWLFRLIQEPIRLGPRYVIGNLKFIYYLIRNHL